MTMSKQKQMEQEKRIRRQLEEFNKLPEETETDGDVGELPFGSIHLSKEPKRIRRGDTDCPYCGRRGCSGMPEDCPNC